MPALWIWLAVAAFALLGMAIAVAARRGADGSAVDYFLAGQGLGPVVSGLSYAATTYSAFMLVVLTGLTYRGGVGALGFELIYFSGLMLLVIFGPRFWLAARVHGIVTPPELLARRYGSRQVGRVAALVSLAFLMPYCTTQMAGIGLLLSVVTDGAIPLTAAVATGAGLALLWTLAAGLRSVAWTDAVQAVVMLVSALLAVGFVVAAIGGPAQMIETLIAEQPQWLDVPGPGLWSLPTFLALSLPWFFFPLSNPQVSQRLFTLRDIRALRGMILWVLGFGLVFTLISVIWGFAALILAPGLENTSTATPALLASGTVPRPVAILLIVGILSAAVSTLDSIALTLGSMVARDLGPQGTGDRAQVMTGRIVVVLVILFASGFALRQAAIVDQLAALSAAGLVVSVPAIIGAFFWYRGTAAGAFCSLAGGAGVALWLAMGEGISVFNPLLPCAVLGTATVLFVGISLITKPRPGALDFNTLKPRLSDHRIW